MKVNQLFIIADDVRNLNIIKESIENEIATIKSEIDSVIQELENIRIKNEGKTKNFITKSEEVIQDFINNIYPHLGEYSSGGAYYTFNTYLPDKFIDLVKEL